LVRRDFKDPPLLHNDWLSVLFIISVQSGRSSSQTGTNGTFLQAEDADTIFHPTAGMKGKSQLIDSCAYDDDERVEF